MLVLANPGQRLSAAYERTPDAEYQLAHIGEHFADLAMDALSDALKTDTLTALRIVKIFPKGISMGVECDSRAIAPASYLSLLRLIYSSEVVFRVRVSPFQDFMCKTY